MLRYAQCWVIGVILVVGTYAVAAPLGTAFTYQGELKQNGVAANGAFDFEVALFGAL